MGTGALPLPSGPLLRKAWSVGNWLICSSVVRPMGTVLSGQPIAFPKLSTPLGTIDATDACPGCWPPLFTPAAPEAGAADARGAAAKPFKTRNPTAGFLAVALQS